MAKAVGILSRARSAVSAKLEKEHPNRMLA